MAPGATQTFVGGTGEGEEADLQYVVTQDDIDTDGGGDGLINNLATADSEETDPTTDTADVAVTQDPDLAISKTATTINGVEITEGSSVDEAGDVIAYTLVVTNEGNQTLTQVEVEDDLTGFSTTIASLAPGASQTFVGGNDLGEYADLLYTVTQADIDTDGGVDGLSLIHI